MTHNGEAIAKNFKEMQFPDFRVLTKPNVKTLREMRIDPSMNTIVLVEHGTVFMRDCLLTLSSLPKDLTRNVPALVALPKTHVNIINCEFIGSAILQTAGIVSMNAFSFVVSSTHFKHFRAGAVHSVGLEPDHSRGKRGTEFLLTDSEIEDCQLMGVYF